MKVFDQINLLPPRPRALHRRLLTVILLLASWWLCADAWRRYKDRVELTEDRARQSQQVQRAAEMRAIELAQQNRRLRELDELVKPWLGAATFPWDEVMLSVERLKMPGLKVAGLSVDAMHGTAKLLIECDDVAQAAQAARTLDLGRSDNDLRWQLLRVHVKATPSAGYEAELLFNAVPAEVRQGE